MRTLRFPTFTSAEKDVNGALNIVIAYEDLETGKRAMKTYDCMVDQLGERCLFTSQMWKFDVLVVPRLKEIAAKDAAAAEIVIVSAHSGKPLPQEVTAWIDLWLSFKGHTTALVGLFDEESASCPARHYLAEIARSANVEFFCQPGIWPENHGRHTKTANTCTQKEKGLTFLANTLHDTPRISHWGINE